MNISISCRDNTQIRRIRARIAEELRLLNLPEIKVTKVELSFFKNEEGSGNHIVCNLKIQLQDNEDISISSNSHSELSSFLNAYEMAVSQLEKINLSLQS